MNQNFKLLYINRLIKVRYTPSQLLIYIVPNGHNFSMMATYATLNYSTTVTLFNTSTIASSQCQNLQYSVALQKLFYKIYLSYH